MPSSSEDVATSARSRPGLQLLFDLGTLRGGQRAMVGTSQLFARQFIDRARQPLGDPPAVDENDGGVALANDLDQTGMDGGPDRGPLGALGSRTAGQLLTLAHARHILHRHFDAQVQLLRFAGIDDGDRTIGDEGSVLSSVGSNFRRSRRKGSTPEKVRHLFQRPLGGGETNSLHPAFGDCLQPLEREGQMRPALGGHHRVDLIDDHCIHPAQARRRRPR